ncbi:MAG: peptidoglycan DD-metalloendopeptidase family protein [bacterium]|nr:peptidoglycan DD-metalloendopeptidase family protein [bacterium]
MKRIKQISAIFIIALLVITLLPIKTNAKTLNDMYSDLASLKAKKQKSDSEKSLTTAEINKVKQNIQNTNNQISQAQSDIVQANKDITKLEKEIDDKKEQLKQVVLYMQLTESENVMLDYVLESEDTTERMLRQGYAEQISSYNQQVVEESNKLINELNEKKVLLANKQSELETKKVTLNQDLESLGTQLSAITETSLDINDEITALQDSIAYYEKICTDKNKDVSSCSSMPAASGWAYPLAKGYVTSNFGWRVIWGSSQFHNGIDFGGNSEGTAVYPAAGGKVAGVLYKRSCGGNQVYIHHTVNGKNYTTAYLHLLTINVSVGTIVNTSTVIGTVGGGAGTRAWETCSTGAHLHFSLASGHYLGGGYSSYATFTANQINPRQIFPNLPAEGSGKYFYR